MAQVPDFSNVADKAVSGMQAALLRSQVRKVDAEVRTQDATTANINQDTVNKAGQFEIFAPTIEKMMADIAATKAQTGGFSLSAPFVQSQIASARAQAEHFKQMAELNAIIERLRRSEVPVAELKSKGAEILLPAIRQFLPGLSDSLKTGARSAYDASVRGVSSLFTGIDDVFHGRIMTTPDGRNVRPFHKDKPFVKSKFPYYKR